MARPTKRTPEVERKITLALSGGNTRRASCLYAGISQDTFAVWLARFPDFSDAIKAAEATAETRMVAIIQTAAARSWQAAAWWLERKQHGDWGRKDTVKAVGDKDAPPIKVEISVVYDEPI